MTDEPQPSATDLMREQRLQRNLKIVVAALAALIVVGLGAVMVRVLGLASGSGERVNRRSTNHRRRVATRHAGTRNPAGFEDRIRITFGNRLAVHHDGPAGAGITILDLETGQRLFDVKPVESLPRN